MLALWWWSVKIAFCSEFPDIQDSTVRKTRRRTQAIAKRYAFHTNAKIVFFSLITDDGIVDFTHFFKFAKK